jgi:hypothetical protein
MNNDWRDFIVRTRRIVDNAGCEHLLKIPPSWKIELQIWEIFESVTEAVDLEIYLQNFDLIVKVVALLLDLSVEYVEDNFESEEIEAIFSTVWVSISPNLEKAMEEAEFTAKSQAAESFSLSKALAMFSVECGWLPEHVLEMPRVQVLKLSTAIAEYIAQQMKFTAAIHGVSVDSEEGAGLDGDTQIKDETYWKDLAAQGIPVEVK